MMKTSLPLGFCLQGSSVLNSGISASGYKPENGCLTSRRSGSIHDKIVSSDVLEQDIGPLHLAALRLSGAPKYFSNTGQSSKGKWKDVEARNAAVVTMPALIAREKSGENENVKIDTLLELRPFAAAGFDKNEKGHELWFPSEQKNQLRDYKKFNDLLEKKLEKSIKTYISKSKPDEMQDFDGGLQVHMTRLELNVLRDNDTYKGPPNTCRSTTPFQRSQNERGSPTRLKLPSLEARKGPVNLIQQGQLSTPFTVVQSKADPMSVVMNARNDYSRNLEKNWLVEFYVNLGKKKLEKKTLNWLESRIDVIKDDFSKAFYYSEDFEDEQEIEDTLEEAVTSITEGFKSDQDVGSEDFNDLLTIHSTSEYKGVDGSMLHTPVMTLLPDEPELLCCVSESEEGEDPFQKIPMMTPHTDEPEVKLYMSQTPTPKQNEPEFVRYATESEGVHAFLLKSPVMTPMQDEPELVRYASMEVLLSDHDDTDSENDIAVELCENGLYDVKVKGKMRKKWRHDELRFADLIPNEEENDIEKKIQMMTDVEIRAMRLKLNKKEPQAKVAYDWNEMSKTIMNDIRSLIGKKKKKKKSKNKVTVINFREKFLEEFGYLLNETNKREMEDRSQENMAKFLSSVSDDFELIKSMPASRRASLTPSKHLWRRNSRSVSPYKNAKALNRPKVDSRCSSDLGSTLHDTVFTEGEEVEELDDFNEMEEMELMKTMVKRRISHQLTKPDFIIYDKQSARLKTKEEKEAELSAMKKKKKSSAKSSGRRGSNARHLESAVSEKTLEFLEETEAVSDYVVNSTDIVIPTKLKPRPNSACFMPKTEPEINLYDLLEGIDFPAKDVKIAVVYRRRRRQRLRARQKLEGAKSQKEEDVTKDVKLELTPMVFTEDAPFVKACLSWNQKSLVRQGFSNEELDKEITNSSGLFWEFKDCRWIRWDKRQTAALERLWELELYDAAPWSQDGQPK